MSKKIFIAVLSAVAAGCFVGSVAVESADIGGMVKEQKQKLTEKAGASQGMTGGDFDAKIKEQEKLIEKSVASKTLSKDEAKIVDENLKGIRKRYNTAKADGKMTATEHDKLQNMLDRNSKMITDKKNNPVKPFSRPEVTVRFEIQQRSIDNGIKSGELTKQEAAQLQDNLAKVKEKYAKLTKDNKFTPAEEEKIHEMLDKDSKMIESKKK